jgi:hypothetical protein
MSALTPVFVVLYLLYLLVALAAGFAGFDHFMPWWAAALLFGLALILGLEMVLPLAVFLGAWLAWEWHWLAALLFAAPGLLVVIPTISAVALGSLAERLPFSRLNRR